MLTLFKTSARVVSAVLAGLLLALYVDSMGLAGITFSGGPASSLTAATSGGGTLTINGGNGGDINVANDHLLFGTSGTSPGKIFFQPGGSETFMLDPSGGGAFGGDALVPSPAAGILGFYNSSDVQTANINANTGAVGADHFNQYSGAHDAAGTITLASATSASYTFGTAFTSAPVCTLTPTSSASACANYYVTTSTTAVTANVTTACSITFNYTCVGNPD